MKKKKVQQNQQTFDMSDIFSESHSTLQELETRFAEFIQTIKANRDFGPDSTVVFEDTHWDSPPSFTVTNFREETEKEAERRRKSRLRSRERRTKIATFKEGRERETLARLKKKYEQS